MNIITKFRLKYKSLSPTERRIVDFILEHTRETQELTSTQLAAKIDVGQSTIIKLVQKFGFKGYTDFKMELASMGTTSQVHAQQPPFHQNISIESSLDEIYGKLVEESIHALKMTYMCLDKHVLNESVSCLNQANKVLLAGMGTSSLVAKDMYYKLLKIGKTAFYSDDIHITYQIPTFMEKGDVCVLISYSGQTKELIKLCEILKKQHIKVLLITACKQSPLAKLADLKLLFISEETLFRTSAMCSRITQLSLIDLLFLGLVKNNYEQAMTCITHNREVTGWSK